MIKIRLTIVDCPFPTHLPPTRLPALLRGQMTPPAELNKGTDWNNTGWEFSARLSEVSHKTCSHVARHQAGKSSHHHWPWQSALIYHTLCLSTATLGSFWFLITGEAQWCKPCTQLLQWCWFSTTPLPSSLFHWATPVPEEMQQFKEWCPPDLSPPFHIAATQRAPPHQDEMKSSHL